MHLRALGWKIALGILLAVLSVTEIAAQTAPASVPLVTLAPAKRLTRVTRVGVLTDNYPYSFRDTDGKVKGFAYDLVREIELAMGLRCQRIARRDYPVTCEHLRTALHQPSLRAHSRNRCDRLSRVGEVGSGRAERVGRLRDSRNHPAPSDRGHESEESCAHGRDLPFGSAHPLICAFVFR